MDTVLVTKTKFAEELGVGKSAVSNWIDRGIISGSAIVGEGRRAKVNLEIAREQVRRNRDIGQSLGNGIATKTAPVQSDARSTPAASEAPRSNHDVSETAEGGFGLPLSVESKSQEEILAERLESMRRKNRIEAIKEAELMGALVGVEDARKQMDRIAKSMLQAFEGALPDLAAVVAERFDVPQRDVLHLLREKFVSVRREAAKKERRRVEETQKDVTVSMDVNA